MIIASQRAAKRCAQRCCAQFCRPSRVHIIVILCSATAAKCYISGRRATSKEHNNNNFFACSSIANYISIAVNCFSHFVSAIQFEKRTALTITQIQLELL